MCGIAGVFRSEGAVSASEIHRLSEILSHRGPDDRGFLGIAPGRSTAPTRDPEQAAGLPLALVHRRLAIIDPTPAGWQPMLRDRFAIVYNGELYNYLELRAELESAGEVFHTDSDTEVLMAALAHWGEAALKRFVGMFAFALVDRRSNRLFLARDPFGIKPLHIAWFTGGFAFASEIKALRTLPEVSDQLNEAVLTRYLADGGPGPLEATFFADVKAVPPGHCLDIDLSRPADARPKRYWSPEIGGGGLRGREAAEAVRAIFLDNVRLHLRSDVPVGAALSGGVDSSSVVMAMRCIGGPDLVLHGFSHIGGDGAPSEERWIDVVGAAANVTLHKVRVSGEEFRRDLDSFLWHQDEPTPTTSMYAQYRVFAAARAAGVTVTLDGQGADEMLAGYPTYVAARAASLLRQGEMKEGLAFLIRTSRTNGLGLGGAVLRTLSRLFPQAASAVRRPPPWLRVKAPAEHSRVKAPDRELLKAQLIETLEQTSLPPLLRYADRNAMCHAVESRLPFLTPDFHRLVLSLPEEELLARDGTTKAVFRQAMRGLVPDAVLDRRDKVGFVAPTEAWLCGLDPDASRDRAEALASVVNLDRFFADWEKARRRRVFAPDIVRLILLLQWHSVLGQGDRPKPPKTGLPHAVPPSRLE